jgi:Na+-translocating ferredoxin:NAD+ oxidoreductase subunit B
MNSVQATLVNAVNSVLPQTQCTRCGYPDCSSYAQAVVVHSEAINRCPPGGAQGIERLAALTGQPISPLNPENGIERPRFRAVIDEAWCIGCTLCIQACPVDSIVGAPKQMHTVMEAHCTGCELCIAPCPVDCISLENASQKQTGWQAWSPEQAQNARERYEFRAFRLERHQHEHEALLAEVAP